MSVRQRGSSHYEVILLLVVLIIVLTPFDTVVTRPLIVALLGVVVVFALWTSGAADRLLIAAAVVSVASVGIAVAGQLVAGRFARGIPAAVTIAMGTAAIAAIFAHLARQRRVTRRTVSGALSVYLLFGLVFAAVFVLIGVVNAHGFFAQPGPHDATDYVYFSYVSLTTVGYGDLTAGPAFGRVMAMLEALVGQLYLVTIVAVVVGNIGRERDRR